MDHSLRIETGSSTGLTDTPVPSPSSFRTTTPSTIFTPVDSVDSFDSDLSDHEAESKSNLSASCGTGNNSESGSDHDRCVSRYDSVTFAHNDLSAYDYDLTRDKAYYINADQHCDLDGDGLGDISRYREYYDKLQDAYDRGYRLGFELGGKSFTYRTALQSKPLMKVDSSNLAKECLSQHSIDTTGPTGVLIPPNDDDEANPNSSDWFLYNGKLVKNGTPMTPPSPPKPKIGDWFRYDGIWVKNAIPITPPMPSRSHAAAASEDARSKSRTPPRRRWSSFFQRYVDSPPPSPRTERARAWAEVMERWEKRYDWANDDTQ